MKKNLCTKRTDFELLFFFFVALDYEWWSSNNQPNPFRFIVACTILSSQITNNIDFQLDLLDVNDNPPIFTQTNYSISIYENTTIGTIVSSSILATDADWGFNGMINYSLSNSSDYVVS